VVRGPQFEKRWTRRRIKPKEGNKSRTKERKSIILKRRNVGDKDRYRGAVKWDKDRKGELLKLISDERDIYTYSVNRWLSENQSKSREGRGGEIPTIQLRRKFDWDFAYVGKHLLTAIVILFASVRLSARKSSNPTGRISLNLKEVT